MNRSTPPPTLPLVMLGMLTVATFAGPFVILGVLQGGRSTVWPPDRPVEWWTLGLVVGAVVMLMGACLSLARQRRPRQPTERAPRAHDEEAP
jgi:hypothetical protein